MSEFYRAQDHFTDDITNSSAKFLGGSAYNDFRDSVTWRGARCCYSLPFTTLMNLINFPLFRTTKRLSFPRPRASA